MYMLHCEFSLKTIFYFNNLLCSIVYMHTSQSYFAYTDTVSRGQGLLAQSKNNLICFAAWCIFRSHSLL